MQVALCHISEVFDNFVHDLAGVFKPGAKVKATVLKVSCVLLFRGDTPSLPLSIAAPQGTAPLLLLPPLWL